METLKIEASIDTPTVLFDFEKGYFELSGKSYPEDTLEFYAPILEKINEYAINPKEKSHLVFKLIYFNSSSYKPILDLIRKMEEIKNMNKFVTIEWQYKTGDTDMKEVGEEFAEVVTVPFSYATF